MVASQCLSGSLAGRVRRMRESYHVVTHSKGDNMFLLSLVTPPESRVGCGSVPPDSKMSGHPLSVQ